ASDTPPAATHPPDVPSNPSPPAHDKPHVAAPASCSKNPSDRAEEPSPLHPTRGTGSYKSWTPLSARPAREHSPHAVASSDHRAQARQPGAASESHPAIDRAKRTSARAGRE